MVFLLHWLILTVAVLAATYILPGVTIAGFWTSVVVALVLGVLNAVVRPILLALTLPVNILTLGLFTLVINALVIMLAAAIVPGFAVRGFWSAFLFSIFVSVIAYLLTVIVM